MKTVVNSISIAFTIILCLCISYITADECSAHTSCSSCQDFGCVWCKTKTDVNGTKQSISVCLGGDIRGPQGGEMDCDEFYYYQCTIPAQNSYMYIILIVCALIFIIAIIAVSIFLCCRFCCTDAECCTCCQQEEDSDYDKHQKESPRNENAGSNRAKEIEMRDYHTKHKALLEKCLSEGSAGNEPPPQQEQEFTPPPSAPPILDPNTIAILDHSSPLIIPVYDAPAAPPPGYFSTHHILNHYQDKPPTPSGSPPQTPPETPPPAYNI